MAAPQRAPRQHRSGHKGAPADGTRPQRPPAVRLPHPARLRGEPASAADRSHRPVPDAPRRPGHAVGGDLAGDGAAGPRRQDQLRRQQQLRCLGRGPRPVGRLGPALPRPDLRAKPVQPRHPSYRDGADSRATQPRYRPDPLQPAPPRAARRSTPSRHRGTHLRRLDPATHRGAPRPARSLRRAVPGLGCETG